MASDILEAGLAALAFARKASLEMIGSIGEDKYLFQPVEGANHALWIMGHLACTDEYFLKNIGGRPFNKFESWQEKFFMGSTPSPDASTYPAAEEVKETMANNRERLISWFKSLDQSQLLSPLPEDFITFAPTHAALISTIAWHEGMHTGQLTVIRKSLGLAPVFA